MFIINEPTFSALMNAEKSAESVAKYAQEVVTMGELVHLLETENKPKAYIGFEPSGFLHIGSLLVPSRTINAMLDSGFDVTVLLADWHAFINDKLGGSLEKIKACGSYMADAFSFMTEGRQGLHFVYASDMIAEPGYWTDLIRNAKHATLQRLKRAMTIMGRNEDEAELDSSKLLYPLMQVTDIFRLDVDVAYAGMDQRRAHMLAREVAESSGRKKPIAIHTPLLSSLKSTSRMDAAVSKMSKSDPSSAIYVHDDMETIRTKLKSAFCPKETEGNPVLDICRYVVFPYMGKLDIERSQKYGGDISFHSYEELSAAYAGGMLHPMDLKAGVAAALWGITKALHEHYSSRPELLEWMKGTAITR